MVLKYHYSLQNLFAIEVLVHLAKGWNVDREWPLIRNVYALNPNLIIRYY